MEYCCSAIDLADCSRDVCVCVFFLLFVYCSLCEVWIFMKKN